MTDGTYCESRGTSVAWISSGANKTLDDDDNDDDGKKNRKQGQDLSSIMHHLHSRMQHLCEPRPPRPTTPLVCLSTRYGGRFTGLSDCVHQHSVVKAAALG